MHWKFNKMRNQRKNWSSVFKVPYFHTLSWEEESDDFTFTIFTVIDSFGVTLLNVRSSNSTIVLSLKELKHKDTHRIEWSDYFSKISKIIFAWNKIKDVDCTLLCFEFVLSTNLKTMDENWNTWVSILFPKEILLLLISMKTSLLVFPKESVPFDEFMWYLVTYFIPCHLFYSCLL